MRLISGWFHAHRQRLRAGGPPWTIHRGGECHPSEHITFAPGVRVETREKENRLVQPSVLVQAFSRFLLGDGRGGHVFSNAKTRRGRRGKRGQK